MIPHFSPPQLDTAQLSSAASETMDRTHVKKHLSPYRTVILLLFISVTCVYHVPKPTTNTPTQLMSELFLNRGHEMDKKQLFTFSARTSLRELDEIV